mgnify:CR=1 FL=1
MRAISEDHLQHFGVIGMRWGVRTSDSTSKSPKKPMKTRTKVAIAAVSVAAIAGLAYVGHKKLNKIMLKGAEKKYNELVPIRDKLSEVKAIKDQTLKEFMKYNKDRYDMGKLYFIKHGLK